MPRKPTCPLLPTLALVALVLLTPTLATALPQGATIRSAAERAEAIPSLLSKLWSLLSTVWANGSGLEPNGTGSDPSSGLGIEPDAATGDNGSILEPDGRP